MGNKTVISFTHTNYCIRPAGTEKHVRDISKILQKNGICHINFFSFYDDAKRMKNKKIGVNLDDKFIGIYNYYNLLDLVDWFIGTYDLEVCSIQFQHLLNHDLGIISNLVLKIKVPVFFVFHDYYLICPHVKLINSNGEFCEISEPNNCKCHKCDGNEASIKHFGMVKQFLQDVAIYIKYMITPSDYVTSRLKKVFPNFEDKIITRSHLIMQGVKKYSQIDGEIKIAFVGGQFAAKGYKQWKRIVEELKGVRNYKLYYFGTGSEKLYGVKNVYVSAAEQGEDAMVRALEKENITVAFLWPNWAETYSYVYYELAVNGIFMMSNKISGNICSEIESNHNGKLFDTFTDCIKWLMDADLVRSEINEYRQSEQGFHPETFINNDDLNTIIDTNIVYKSRHMLKVHPQLLYTTFYRIKYRNNL